MVISHIITSSRLCALIHTRGRLCQGEYRFLSANGDATMDAEKNKSHMLMSVEWILVETGYKDSLEHMQT